MAQLLISSTQFDEVLNVSLVEILQLTEVNVSSMDAEFEVFVKQRERLDEL